MMSRIEARDQVTGQGPSHSNQMLDGPASTPSGRIHPGWGRGGTGQAFDR